MDVLECMKTRRSVRKYTEQPLEQETIDRLLEAAAWTPSGKNGQPWRFKIITEQEAIHRVSELSVYSKWMKKSKCLFLVFLDKDHSYHYLKDAQACGAAMQNILLCAHSMGVGSCWIGDLFDKSNEVKELLDIQGDNLELMGLVTLGYPEGKAPVSNRKPVESLLL